MKNILLLILFLSSFACSKKYTDSSAPLPDSIEASVQSSFRSEENVERDQYQHPAETLTFFGIKPSMTVVEVSPGAGYFTEILAPFLSKEGMLMLAVPRMPQRPPQILIDNENKIQDIMMRNSDVKEHTRLMPFEPIDKRNMIQRDFADLVIAFNSTHNWVAQNSAKSSFKLFHDIMKPGGVLGIVQHRVREGSRKVPKSGYMYEHEVIALAKSVGFKFIGKSEINANPLDKANYPEGVWVLPPTYRLGDKDRRKYEKIGESDRMTLKFVK